MNIALDSCADMIQSVKTAADGEFVKRIGVQSYYSKGLEKWQYVLLFDGLKSRQTSLISERLHDYFFQSVGDAKLQPVETIGIDFYDAAQVSQCMNRFTKISKLLTI